MVVAGVMLLMVVPMSVTVAVWRQSSVSTHREHGHLINTSNSNSTAAAATAPSRSNCQFLSRLESIRKLLNIVLDDSVSLKLLLTSTAMFS